MFRRFRKQKTPAEPADAPVEDLLAAAEPIRGRLFQVTGPEDGSCVCNDWVGAVLSVEGAAKACPALSDAVADGLFHPGCRHRLRPFDDREGGEDPAQARFRTDLVLDLMGRRAEALEPSGEDRFTRLYDWARRADRAGTPTAAVALCEAALRLLRDTGAFSDNQTELERILKARVATIRARFTDK